MSRIISGKVRLDVQRVDLLPVITTAIESVKPMADGRRSASLPSSIRWPVRSQAIPRVCSKSFGTS